MRVAVDVTPLVQTRAGTARYIRNLLRHLQVDVQRVSFGGGARAWTPARELWWYPVALRRVDADVLHCTTYRGPLRPRTPLVVTVHDLAAFRHPGAFRPWTRAYSRTVVPQVVRAARRVVAVSEFTRRELVELLGVADDRIRVVPNAVEDTFAPDGPAAEGEYVLAVGTIEPRKNLARLVEAAKRADVQLRVVGERGWGGVEVGGNGVVWLGRVDDDELARLYRGARAVAYPSLYEGFGIPVLEAMACGTPVVTSAGGATEEVAGGAAVLVDPLDAASIAAGIEEADRRRDELRARGLERARAFDWDDVARATEEVYREAAGG